MAADSGEPWLASIGALTLAITTWRGRRRTGEFPSGGLVLLTAGCYFAGISWLLLLAWSRYYLPTLLFGTLLSGLGVAAMIRHLIGISAIVGVRGPSALAFALRR